MAVGTKNDVRHFQTKLPHQTKFSLISLGAAPDIAALW